ncbi:hypothetical protein M426DRAFT_15910 [Hypoxylon sp. CI-4A]|nr:hypothetical protein M426DRAFT_15910 [Hypoxylon sp. CI-4A]
MSAPRTKRQFAGAASDSAQRQITSFFSSSTSSAQDLSSSYINQTTPQTQSPPLPQSVQSNLLSVGMRVRKSVPEGYKTGSYSAFAFWDERLNNANPNTGTNSTTMGEGRSRANAISTPRELLPFCGIHKVGGLAAQPENNPDPSSISSAIQPLLSVNGQPLDDSSMNDDNDDDDVPGLTSSQDTIESISTPSKTRKRSYTEDEDETAPQTPGRLNLSVGGFNVWRDSLDGEVSPRSQAPWNPSPGNGRRAMATPRKFRKHLRGTKLAAQAQAQTLDQENVMVVDGSNDFGEAEFLDRTAELGYHNGGRGWEVEMSDA